MTAMLWTPTVTFGSILWQTVDADGTAWICENLEGWPDTPESDATVVDRTFDHGAWVGEGWYGPRVLTLAGAVQAEDRAGLQKALHQVRGQHARALAQDVTLTVNELDGAKSLTVRTSKAGFAVKYLTPTTARVAFELVAGWPVKQSAVRSASAGGVFAGGERTYPRPDANGWWAYGAAGASGDVQATNNGNAPVRPKFVIAGPVVDPRIIHQQQGRKLDFAITLAEGDRLDIDAMTHSVLLNDVSNRRYVLTPDSAWFDILPGQNTIQFRSDSNTGQLTVYWADGWW